VSAAPSSPEHILCDTNVVSALEASITQQDRIAHWPVEARSRLNAAILAVAIFVVAEVRSGRIEANWSDERIARAEATLDAYLFVPLDQATVDEYVRLRARWRREMSDNDLWIAATAIARGWPLASSDLAFCKLTDDLELIYIPARPDSPASCP